MKAAVEFVFAVAMLPFVLVSLLIVLMLIGAERLIDGDKK